MPATRDLTDAPVELDDATVTYRGDRFRRYLDADTIQSRVAEMGQQISADYADTTPILVSVLNGAFMFTADLMRAINTDCEIDFIKLSSYGAAKVSSGEVHELKSVDAELEGRDVLIVEDIVDTGLSMDFMKGRLQEYNPASLRVATLLHKPTATEPDLTLDYVGFQIPDLFVIGYGLDYGQLARNLADIYILDED
ncbi:hypoxanthine phosphoribosyltransferase [Salinibacter sp. 10B]|uniref:hypoxanthine phosphoribosyltransferase n=1 Tax=Salinibacter sp. 10B TaxID=1923971 RepID=UPI000CF436B2|nr:hypoxanthine phosphoribosyltransferase [Salinibacter sp. 10B]PQJ36259.1 hypoxanthine phosphoribosyltransferase [Salinibacter sp. 10B]